MRTTLPRSVARLCGPSIGTPNVSACFAALANCLKRLSAPSVGPGGSSCLRSPSAMNSVPSPRKARRAPKLRRAADLGDLPEQHADVPQRAACQSTARDRCRRLAGLGTTAGLGVGPVDPWVAREFRVDDYIEQSTHALGHDGRQAIDGGEHGLAVGAQDHHRAGLLRHQHAAVGQKSMPHGKASALYSVTARGATGAAVADVAARARREGMPSDHGTIAPGPTNANSRNSARRRDKLPRVSVAGVKPRSSSRSLVMAVAGCVKSRPLRTF